MNIEHEYMKWLRQDLLTFPQPRSLILAARYITEHNSNIPRWVRILASANEVDADLIEKVLIAHLDQTIA